MDKNWLRQFHFTKNERQGVQTLLILSAILFVLPSATEYFSKEIETDYSALEAKLAMLSNEEIVFEESAEEFYFDPNTASYDDFIALGLSDRISNRILNYRDKGGKFFDTDDFSKIYGLPTADFERLEGFIQIEGRRKAEFAQTKQNWNKEKTSIPIEVTLKNFNPNTATFNDFLSLGLSERTAHSIENYREKGGHFKYKSDFQKIYTLEKEDFQRLYAFIDLPEKDLALASVGPVTYGNNSTKVQTELEKPQIIDINKSTLEDWQNLNGIGPSYAKRIVNFREKLGGFASLEQVGETYGLPDSVFQNIQVWLQPSTVYRQININTALENELLKHPYISKKQAKLIVAYRKQHGGFQEKTELLNIKILNESWLNKIEPYLSF